jgi:hypothetical protein
MRKNALSEISGTRVVRFKAARVSGTIAVFRFVEGLVSMEGLDVKISEQIL